MRFALSVLMSLLCLLTPLAQAQDDGGVSYDTHGAELLESLDVTPVRNAPFSLQLATEWMRPMPNGGTFTLVNARPIRRDADGRIYEERWLLVPKGSRYVSRMSWIQIGDPIARTLLECNVQRRQCELEDWRGWNRQPPHPELVVSGPLSGGRGMHRHEDLGAQTFAGLPVHGYRETTTVDPGKLGNDLALVTTRETRFSASLSINLSSTLDTPQVGRQVFTVTEITVTEPDPAWFRTPAGYTVHDARKGLTDVKPE